ncbi:MAG TPA: DUF2156 domain-containing protein [bacterium]|nr:DUF2156 domain-containing protein [bacterium]
MKLKDLPWFPVFGPLGLEHRGIIEEYFRGRRAEASELNFTEMFMWRKIRNTSICRIGESMVIKAEKDGRLFFYYPPLGIDAAAVVEKLLETDDSAAVYGLTAEEAGVLGLPAEKYSIEADRKNFDYVYPADGLRVLAGRKYDGKRNHLKKFEVLNYSFEAINGDNIREAVAFQEKWCADRLCDDDMSLQDESSAICELLGNFEELSAFGALLRVEGVVQGYTVADRLNEDTAVVMVEKANPGIRGIYQGLNRGFVEKFLGGFRFINREQDNGNEGLRKAKMSYHPVKFVEKTVIKRRGARP